MVRQGASLSEKLLSKRRPGKKRAEIVRLLVENGGSATREEELLGASAGLKPSGRTSRSKPSGISWAVAASTRNSPSP
jgi:hypothetical protein